MIHEISKLYLICHNNNSDKDASHSQTRKKTACIIWMCLSCQVWNFSAKSCQFALIFNPQQQYEQFSLDYDINYINFSHRGLWCSMRTAVSYKYWYLSWYTQLGCRKENNWYNTISVSQSVCQWLVWFVSQRWGVKHLFG